MTSEEKKQIYSIYIDMLNEYEKAVLNRNLKYAEMIKCTILWKISHLIELSSN